MRQGLFYFLNVILLADCPAVLVLLGIKVWVLPLAVKLAEVRVLVATQEFLLLFQPVPESALGFLVLQSLVLELVFLEFEPLLVAIPQLSARKA